MTLRLHQQLMTRGNISNSTTTSTDDTYEHINSWVTETNYRTALCLSWCWWLSPLL